MTVPALVAKPCGLVTAGLDFVAPLFDLTLRLYVAWVFFRSGLVKLQSWDATLYLFGNEYGVPFLPPELAAYLAVLAELTFPPLIAVGLGTRFFALALFVFNAVAVISYPELSPAGLKDHLLWGALLLVTLFHGPGRLSLDAWLCKRAGK